MLRLGALLLPFMSRFRQPSRLGETWWLCVTASRRFCHFDEGKKSIGGKGDKVNREDRQSAIHKSNSHS
jgi:hypothetical protein